MSYSIVDDEAGDDPRTLLCQLLYCRAEAQSPQLDLVRYFIDMACLELESLLGPNGSDAIPERSSHFQSGEA
ncbi:MAG: hypothetical protein ABR878_13160 [Roseiarcus sp.]|jgi:hypothetical protein